MSVLRVKELLDDEQTMYEVSVDGGKLPFTCIVRLLNRLQAARDENERLKNEIARTRL